MASGADTLLATCCALASQLLHGRMHFCLRHALTENLGSWHCQGEFERI
jgi:hypothetical protein